MGVPRRAWGAAWSTATGSTSRSTSKRGRLALLGTQASTKVYRSPAGSPGAGCAQRLCARVDEGALLAVIPDPVVCFADARYEQAVDVALAPSASLFLLDGYTCGRAARGERWAFAGYASRTRIDRGGARSVIDAVRLDPRHGALADRMGRFDVFLSLLAIGPRFAPVREAMAALSPPAGAGDSVVVAVSPLGPGADAGCMVRVAAERFEMRFARFAFEFRGPRAHPGRRPLRSKVVTARRAIVSARG